MDNEKIIVSVIIPCYNVEKYLEKCVKSILASTFKKFEIILVDDGSPDRSGELADQLAKQDSRIRVIHQPNGGVVMARKTGVEAARGEWITLVDSDDSITPNALEDLFHASIGRDTDIVIGFPLGIEFPDIPQDYCIEQYRSDIIAGTRVQAAPWGRFIRKSIITPFLFDIPRTVRLGDDMIFNIRCAFATEKDPVIVKTYVYDYFTNDESITRTNKRDPEYEQYFHKMRMLSIPSSDHDKYMPFVIADRLHPIQWWSFHNPRDTRWMKSEFITDLKKDIQTYSYHLKFKDRVMLYCNNRLFRLFVIPFFRLVS